MKSLTIARYKNGYITISEYNRTIHKNGEIFCPFCDPSLEVTGVENKFFRALPSHGGHNCNKSAVEYFNADWEGRRLVETLSDENGNIKMTININHLGRLGKGLRKTEKPSETTDCSSYNEIQTYKKYTTYKNVVRDVIRTVVQMKNLIQKNSFDKLNKINFKYIMGNEELSINEIVKFIYELTPYLHSKDRFVIYKVESIKIRNNKIYINSYQTDGISLATSFDYPSTTNQTGIKKDDFVIAFGTLKYYKPKDQYYLNTLSDLNIVKIKDQKIKELFTNKEMTKKDLKKIMNNESSEMKSSKNTILSDVSVKSSISNQNLIKSNPLPKPKIETTVNTESESKLKYDSKTTVFTEKITPLKEQNIFINKVLKGIKKIFNR